MELDKDTQEFVFNFRDKTAMGHPHMPLEDRVSVTYLPELLSRAEERLTSNMSADFSEFPAGPRRNYLVSQRMKNCGVLREILSGFCDYAEDSVVAGVEDFLRSIED